MIFWMLVVGLAVQSDWAEKFKHPFFFLQTMDMSWPRGGQDDNFCIFREFEVWSILFLSQAQQLLSVSGVQVRSSCSYLSLSSAYWNSPPLSLSCVLHRLQLLSVFLLHVDYSTSKLFLMIYCFVVLADIPKRTDGNFFCQVSMQPC
jgi:hypothetical protein